MRDQESTTPAGAPSSAALVFFDEVDAAYRAAATAGSTRFTFRLATYTIELQFAGAELFESITPALEHLRVADGANAESGFDHPQPPAPSPQSPSSRLTIQLWDVASSGIPLPRRPWDWRDNPARGDVLGLGDERIAVSYNHFGHILSLLDRERNRAIWVTTDASASSSYFNAAPLLDILHWWLHPRGLLTVHGGAVGVEAAGVLLVGRGGAGKSTATLACLSSRLRIAGDDYCALSLLGDGELYSLFNSARLERENLDRLPHLRPLVHQPESLHRGDKATVFLHRHEPERLIRHFPLRAVLLPQVTGEKRSRLEPTSRMRAFRELSVSTVNQRAGTGKSAFDDMASVVKRLPCHALAMGTDLSQLADLLEEFILDGGLQERPRDT